MDPSRAIHNTPPRARRARRAFGCAALLAAAAGAGAQGIAPGNLPADGTKLPGGIEPVLQLRTYYFDQESLTGVPSVAWALGGWAGLRSPWLGDVLQLGVVGYTSQRLYGPQDKSGTLLLQPDQDPINVIGLAWAALRFAGQTFTAYRQLIDRPFINPQDNRMVPNTFEAYTLGGAPLEGFAYTGGYVARIKNRDSERFVSMSQDAGGTGSDEGLVYAGVDWDFMTGGRLRADVQYGIDTYNTVYVDAKMPVALAERTRLVLGTQYYPQKSVGDAQIGDFSTWGAGVQAQLTHGPFGAHLSFTRTGTGFNTQNPYGDHPSYLNLQQVAFNTAGERAWGIGGSVNFAEFGVPGLSASAVYAAGRDRVDAATGAPLPNRDETDIRADYRVGKGHLLEGLVATFRYAWLQQDGSPQTQTQARVIVNYPFSF
ncbi:MAG: OprD family outer membrane porin [Burkholderiales bacterium]|nr:OprD family outer membrane porin [Burkholderiales bacterium]